MLRMLFLCTGILVSGKLGQTTLRGVDEMRNTNTLV